MFKYVCMRRAVVLLFLIIISMLSEEAVKHFMKCLTALAYELSYMNVFFYASIFSISSKLFPFVSVSLLLA